MIGFDDNDADWFRTMMSTKLRDYGGFEPTQIVAQRVAREMLQSISERVDQRERLAAQIAGTTSEPAAEPTT